MKKLNGKAIYGVIAAAVIALTSVMPAAAAPLPPTPGVYQPALVNPSPKRIVFAQSRVFAADTRLDSQVMQGYGQIDLQYVIEGFAGGSQTVNLAMRHSNDAINWVNGTDLFGAVTIVTATTDMTRTATYGTFGTLFVDLNGTIPVTMTIIGLVR